MNDVPLPALPAPPDAARRDAISDGAAGLDIRQRSWIKRILPRTMFGRSLLLIVMPLVLVQIISAWVFYARHWETISRRLSSDVAGDVAVVIEAMQTVRTDVELAQLMERASTQTEIDFSFDPAGRLPPAAPGEPPDDQLSLATREHIRNAFRMDALSNPNDVLLQVQLPHGVLSATVSRKRLTTSTTYIFILWMIGSSLVLFFVAAIFLRNQVKSLRRLAVAAESFGKGRPVGFFKVEGALEVRQAGVAFNRMRDRIQRQIRQRTEMLAGVSHDLRTPLTRMKLALELVGDNPAIAELKSDVVDMERLVHLYLDFARGEGTEIAVETDIAPLIEDLAAAARREGKTVSLDQPAELVIPVRPNALRRCLSNLLANGARYGSQVWLTSRAIGDGVEIFVDDDGPGIPPHERDHVFLPFIRLDSSRNPSTGGVGLGLTIARDVARSHGGDVRLETSPRGGLRARIHLPR
ncbi:MAG TPA: ATP-binding protein [Stellaceae bacterium]|nr:ATP-binding protein [Stellaceae bacterium]